MKKFEVGQRVKLTQDCDFAKAGMTGKVVAVEYGLQNTLVDFDEPFAGGHDGNGRCKGRCGYWVYPDRLLLIESEPKTKYQPGDEVTVKSDLSIWVGYYMADGTNRMKVCDQMLTKRGKKVKIKSVTKTGKYMIEGSIFPWVDEMFEDVKPKTETKSKPKTETNSEIYTVVGVQLKDNDRIYNYLCDLENISIDNEVRVPVGKANALLIGKVVSIGKHTKTNAPYNVDQMKKVLRIVESVKGHQFAIGDRVHHPTHGVGTVICIETNGAYGVEFDRGSGHNCKGLQLIAGKEGTKNKSWLANEVSLTLVNELAEPKSEPKVEYYTGRVVCVKKSCPCWTVGKIYEIKNGTIVSDINTKIEHLTKDEIKHIGCSRDIPAKRQKTDHEFLPIVE